MTLEKMVGHAEEVSFFSVGTRKSLKAPKLV